MASAEEIGPQPSQTVTSVDPAGQGQWLRALRRQSWVQAARVDGRRNVMKVARLVALYAQWDTLESRPTWNRLIARSGLAERTVARWLQELRVRGWLAHLEHGSTPATRPMALAHLEGNRAALYGLRIPLTPEEALARAGDQLVEALVEMLAPDSDACPAGRAETGKPEHGSASEQPEQAALGDESGSLPLSVQSSCSSSASGFSRASTPVDNFPSLPTNQATTTTTALRAGSEEGQALDLSIMVPVSGYEMLACAEWLRTRLGVFGQCSRKLVRHLCKPYWRAGWCGRDIVHAMDHRPSVFSQPTHVLLSPAHVVAPAQFIRSRLAAWRTPKGSVLTGYWAAKVADANAAKTARTEVIARYGRAGAALLRGGERTLTPTHITEHGRTARAQARAHLSVGRGCPESPARPARRPEADVRRAELVAEARAELARREGPTAPDIPTTPPIAGVTPYEAARARARVERGRRLRGPRRR